MTDCENLKECRTKKALLLDNDLKTVNKQSIKISPSNFQTKKTLVQL